MQNASAGFTIIEVSSFHSRGLWKRETQLFQDFGGKGRASLAASSESNPADVLAALQECTQLYNPPTHPPNPPQHPSLARILCGWRTNIAFCARKESLGVKCSFYHEDARGMTHANSHTTAASKLQPRAHPHERTRNNNPWWKYKNKKQGKYYLLQLRLIYYDINQVLT